MGAIPGPEKTPESGANFLEACKTINESHVSFAALYSPGLAPALMVELGQLTRIPKLVIGQTLPGSFLDEKSPFP